jgi:hypothetical protein
MKTSLEFRDPADLRLHPLQHKLPQPEKTSPEWLSFVEGWMNAGVESMPPLIITKEGLVMDGGRRWRAAKQLQWAQVPVIERPEHEAAALIVDTLMGQRNLPRGTKVYLALGLMPEWVKASESRRLTNLTRGVKIAQNPNVSPKSSDLTSIDKHPETCEALATRFGVSKETFFRAIRVRKLLDSDENLRALYEPELMSGEKSLWNVEAAIKGAQTDQSTRNQGVEKSQLELFGDAFDKLKTSAKGWLRFTPENQQRVLSSWKKTVEAMPPALRREMLEVLEETAK